MPSLLTMVRRTVVAALVGVGTLGSLPESAQARSIYGICYDITSQYRCQYGQYPNLYEVDNWSYISSGFDGDVAPNVNEICAGGIRPNGQDKDSSRCFNWNQTHVAQIYIYNPETPCSPWGRWKSGAGNGDLGVYATQL